jgi:hypothetical protein
MLGSAYGSASFDCRSDPDLNRHQNKNSHPDPDQHQADADPHHCLNVTKSSKFIDLRALRGFYEHCTNIDIYLEF